MGCRRRCLGACSLAGVGGALRAEGLGAGGWQGGFGAAEPGLKDPPPPTRTGDALHAFELLLALNKLNFAKLRELHKAGREDEDPELQGQHLRLRPLGFTPPHRPCVKPEQSATAYLLHSPAAHPAATAPGFPSPAPPLQTL